MAKIFKADFLKMQIGPNLHDFMTLASFCLIASQILGKTHINL